MCHLVFFLHFRFSTYVTRVRVLLCHDLENRASENCRFKARSEYRDSASQTFCSFVSQASRSLTEISEKQRYAMFFHTLNIRVTAADFLCRSRSLGKVYLAKIFTMSVARFSMIDKSSCASHRIRR